MQHCRLPVFVLIVYEILVTRGKIPDDTGSGSGANDWTAGSAAEKRQHRAGGSRLASFLRHTELNYGTGLTLVSAHLLQ
ncbi:hypothetical protein EDC01DRAFT_405257 [Geopyxis carbonaria]|nr:hypothetical protein EDC01DRAFT_405257 [Geopyxis carbonaria]